MSSTIIFPEEIVEYIISFTCDRRGYNMLKYIERKNANRYRMRRLLVEIRFFSKTGYSIPSLIKLNLKSQRKNINYLATNLKINKIKEFKKILSSKL